MSLLITAMLQNKKAHYTKYCKIVRKFIKEAKKQHYNRRIAKSNNKNKNNMEYCNERDRASTFNGTGSQINCE